MSNLTGVPRKVEDAYPTVATGPCSQCLVESFYFVSLYVLFLLLMFIFVFVCFPAWSLSLDYKLLISARILVPLITLPDFIEWSDFTHPQILEEAVLNPCNSNP